MHPDSNLSQSDAKALEGLKPMTPLELNDIHLTDRHTPVSLTPKPRS